MEVYINDFLNYLKNVKESSASTISGYGNDLKRLKVFLENLNITNVTQITETLLNSYILYLEKQGFSASSVSRSIAAIKSFMLYLLKNGLISTDSSERIKAPKVVKKPPRTLETEQINQLLEKPDLSTKKGIRDKAMLEILYATGMKVSELTTIKVPDINLKARFISCGNIRERNIPFGKTAKKAIDNYLYIRQEQFNKNNNEYMFLNFSGNKLTRQGIWKILKGYTDDIGIENISPNIIRHSFASHMIDNGADLLSVQEFLGHSDISTTQLYSYKEYKNSREVYLNTHPRA